MTTDDTKAIEMDLKTLLESLTNVHKASTAGLTADLESLDAGIDAIEKNSIAAGEELGEILAEAEREIDTLIEEERADRAEDETADAK